MIYEVEVFNSSLRCLASGEHIYIRSTPNLGLEIAVSGREREQGRFRGSTEGAGREQEEGRKSTKGAL